MLDRQVVLPVVGERLVKGRVLVGRDLLGVTSPEGLGLVELLVGDGRLLDGLLLLVLLLLIILNLFDLGLLALLGFLLLVIFDLLSGASVPSAS